LHSLIFAVGVTGVACLAFGLSGASWTFGLLFGWGWLWHILADGLTDHGVPLFWPFNDDRKHILPEWGRAAGRVLLSLSAVGGMLGLILFRLQPYFS